MKKYYHDPKYSRVYTIKKTKNLQKPKEHSSIEYTKSYAKVRSKLYEAINENIHYNTV